MKLSEFKKALSVLPSIGFIHEDGSLLAPHFHITEMGITTKKYIDCGGTLREENFVNFQLWEANDFEHRLHPEKLLKIIEQSEKTVVITDEEVEVEYQTDTIGRYGLSFNGKYFMLIPKRTNCLAIDKCGTNSKKAKISLFELQNQDVNTCDPETGCC
ncbi:MAG: DUF6428 family protein [Bacteroidia bacterium]|nr:hypothetical protein [Bacteroidia bacterium]MCK6650218.1 DUF6428 family protein [Bacteroidia bacterium]